MESPDKVPDNSKKTEINTNQREIYSVLFAEDGKQVLSGGVEGKLQRWQVDDGCQVGESIRNGGLQIFAAALSPDRKWLVCGLGPWSKVRVWDARSQKMVLDFQGHTKSVISVDISPDSTKFATGSADNHASIWSITSTVEKRLVGPLQHEGVVVAVRFSPTGDRIATATAENPPEVAKSIRIYDSDNGQQLLNIPLRIGNYVSSPLAWSADGRRLFAASYSDSEVKCFDAAAGRLLAKWSVPGGGFTASIALSQNQNFIAVVAYKTLSFWDASTYKQIGTTIEHEHTVWSIGLSPDDSCIASGEREGKVTLQSLRNFLPFSYFALDVSDRLSNVMETNGCLVCFLFLHLQNLPLMHIGGPALKSWIQGDLTCTESLLTDETARPSDPFRHSQALAHRALIRCRLKQWDLAVKDAEKSIEVQRSIVGYIARAMTHIRNTDHESAMREFDLVFSDGLPAENNYLLLIKAIILFLCKRHEDATLRANYLINLADDKSLYVAVRAQMHLLAGTLFRKGDDKREMELLQRAQESIQFQRNPHLMAISLITGWDFSELERAIRQHVQDRIKLFERQGDEAAESNPKEAILRYSDALSLKPPRPAGLFIKRSKVRGTLRLWKDALQDADEATNVDPQNHWGYEVKRAALHALRRYDDAINAFKRMYSLIEGSSDQGIRQRGMKYISPAESEEAIDQSVSMALKICPLVLIDVKSGRLCDHPERRRRFKSEPEFKELHSSITEKLENDHIQRVVKKYFRYVTLSHVWNGKEPLLQDVDPARGRTVWDLESSPPNEKLRSFCKVVREAGYRWAWSDTCCIDKTISTVLNESLKMMYEWYKESTATFIYLADVDSPSALGDLTKSRWMRRAWTAQELLAGKVVRFYDRSWRPYLGDARSNHKNSPEIMQELADAIGIARETIISFHPDNLTVREKLRIASTRDATRDEDMAYSLIGIFDSNIIPNYGEGSTAVGRLLEEIVMRWGEVKVLAWTGKSSSYNSCLPATLRVYSRAPRTPSTIEGAAMNKRAAAIKDSVPKAEATRIHAEITRLRTASFATRRLRLPCIVFPVKELKTYESGRSNENHYQAQIPGIGNVKFQTSDRLSDPHRLILVHPWIEDICDPSDGFAWRKPVEENGYGSHLEVKVDVRSRTPSPLPNETMDICDRALRLIVRLQQPFLALLLQQQRNGREFRRVAAEHEIVAPGIERSINLARDVHVEVVDIL